MSGRMRGGGSEGQSEGEVWLRGVGIPATRPLLENEVGR